MADFFPTGPIDLYISERRPYANWYYLGSAVGWPEVEVTRFHKNLTSDRSGDAPWQKVQTGEVHHVVVTLNRFNINTLNRVRAGTPFLSTYTLNPGRLVLASSDFLLFIRYGVSEGLGSPSGRLYFSATYAGGRQDEPSKVQEVGIIFSCNPLHSVKDKTFYLYTENESNPLWPKGLILE